MQHARHGWRRHPSSRCFNPHPARRPDATCIGHGWVNRHGHCFNPHPARRPDATCGTKGRCQRCAVMLFQSSSGQKAGCNPYRMDLCTPCGYRPCTVSILIRPEGRMQPIWLSLWLTHPKEFQRTIRPEGHVYQCFNPHPARRPDATAQDQPFCASILIRLLAAPLSPLLFQSSSGQKAGCNLLATAPSEEVLAGFNPHPARRPDATAVPCLGSGGRMNCGADAQIGQYVSILIRPEGRMQPTPGRRVLDRVFYAILIRPEGRMQPQVP